MNRFIITIDGPAASGKSTAAKQTAKQLNCIFLDTGAMYRAVTLLAIKQQITLTDPKALLKLFDCNQFLFTPDKNQMTVSVNGQDITAEIRTPQVTENIHYIAGSAKLRSRLVQLQRDFALRFDRIVTEGRDQGTVVFPDANLKFFLIADTLSRAKRRQLELQSQGIEQNLQELKRAVEARDLSDQQRSTGPLKKAQDAIEIDTTNMTIEQVVNKIIICASKESVL